MDGLDEFEKSLAADKAEREKAQRREERSSRHKHHHDHHHRHRSSREDRDDHDRHHHRKQRDEDDDGHRHKRSRREDEGRDSERSHRRHRDDRHRDDEDRHLKSTDQMEDLPAPDQELPRSEDPIDSSRSAKRDDWMTAPSALEVDYINRPRKVTPPPKEEPKRVVHTRELNHALNDEPNDPASAAKEVNYTIGDAGSNWRMTKLATVYTAAKESGRAVDDIALERFGDLVDFDFAREEKEELDRRRLYGKGYETKEKPSGELHRERLAEALKHAPQQSEPEQGTIVPDPTSSTPAIGPSHPAVADQTALNRLKAQMMKAKLRRAPNAAQLEAEYAAAAAAFKPSTSSTDPIILSAQDSSHLAGTRGEVKAVTNKRGRERGTVVENDEMTIEDMVREERRTKHQSGSEGLRLAERIAKDGKFTADLDYQDENAEKLAKRVHKSDINLKNTAISQVQKLNRILDNCPLCHNETANTPPIAPVVSLGTRTFLTLPTEPELVPHGAVLAPISHRNNLLECDDDEWEELRNFMKSLTRMYHDQGSEVLFYENAAHPHRHPHAALIAVPIPYEQGATAPAFFREAFLSADEEWSQHKKIIDTGKLSTEGGAGRQAFRRAIAKEMPYFHVWFTLDGGLGHVIEDGGKWPKGDLFAREVIGGIVDSEPHLIKKQGRWHRGDTARVDGFRKMWNKFDWTRMLAE